MVSYSDFTINRIALGHRRMVLVWTSCLADYFPDDFIRVIINYFIFHMDLRQPQALGTQQEPLVIQRVNKQASVVKELNDIVRSLFPRFKSVLRQTADEKDADKSPSVPCTGIPLVDDLDDNTRTLIETIELIHKFKDEAAV